MIPTFLFPPFFTLGSEEPEYEARHRLIGDGSGQLTIHNPSRGMKRLLHIGAHVQQKW